MTTAEQLYQQAAALDKEGQADKAITLYTGAAELGYVPAQLRTGVAYLSGKGTAQDYQKAVYWLQKAADQNNASAISNLALCYSNGYGVAKDEQKAMALYQKAANLGDTTASKQFDLLQKKSGASAPHTPSATAEAAPAASGSSASSGNANDFISKIFSMADQAVPTVDLAVQLSGPENASTTVSVYVPEFKRSVSVKIPNTIAQGQSLMISAATNAAATGINSPLKVHITKVTRVATPQAPVMQQAPQAAQVRSTLTPEEIRQKVKAYKRRVYVRPVINLIATLWFILSAAALFVLSAVFPDVRMPQYVHNLIGSGFSIGFILVFWFWFLPWIIGRYPKAGFFKTRKILRHLEKRKLLEKAVVEMETCTLSDFGDRMCLSDHFLFYKKKNGIIIPCDEILWLYEEYAKPRFYGHLMLGTKHWGIMGLSGAMYSKNYAEIINAGARALQHRVPGLMMGSAKGTRKKYDSLRAKK